MAETRSDISDTTRR